MDNLSEFGESLEIGNREPSRRAGVETEREAPRKRMKRQSELHG